VPDELQFLQLSWERFEDLTEALAREVHDLAIVSRYGVGGQKQDGIDVIGIGRADGRACAYQCKRVEKFGEADLGRAVGEFANGARPFDPVRLVVAVAVAARRTQVIHRLMAERASHPEFDLVLWDATELCDLLRNRPWIVSRFFGKDVARRFCPSEGYPSTASPDDVCPYPGLASFEADQERWFFGREAVITDVCQRLDYLLTAAGPLIVVAPSGAGKSSLLRAGVVPALGEGRLPVAWPCALMTPTDHPVRALEERMKAAACAAGDGMPARTVLVVDQFEEVFTLCADEGEREAFIGELCRLADHPATSTGPSALVVIGLRADFHDRCLRYEGLSTAVRACTVRLGAMSAGELRRAIIAPAEAAGLQVEAGLPELLLSDAGLVGPGPDQATRLPLLAHALRATWQQREGHFLTVGGYRAAGGIGQGVATTAEREYSLLDAAGQRLAKALFLRLVKVGDGLADLCRPARPGELERDLPDCTGVTEVIDRFRRARLLAYREDAVTIAHEALLSSWPRLSNWIAEGRNDHLIRQRLEEATAAWTWDRDASALYLGKRLRAALAWACGHQADIGPGARHFLTVSSRRSNRIRAVRLAAISVAVVLALAAGTTSTIAIGEHAAHLRETDHAAYEQAITEARQQTARDPQLAAMLDLTAYRIQRSATATARLIGTENTPLYSQLGAAADVAAYSPAGDVFATGGDSLQLWVGTSSGRARPLGHPFGHISHGSSGGLQAMAFLGNGHWLAIIEHNRLRLWNVSHPAHPHSAPVVADAGIQPGLVSATAFNPHRDLLAIAGGNSSRGAVTLWNLSDPRRPRKLGHALKATDGAATSVALSPNGRMLAVGDIGGYVGLWNITKPTSPQPIHRWLPASPDNGLVSSLAFSPDGATLAADADAVSLWHVAGPQRPSADGHALAGCADGPGTAVFGRSGLLVVGCADGSDHGGSVRLWDVTDPARPVPDGPAQMTSGQVRSLALSADGRTLVSAGPLDRALVWSLPPVMFGGSLVSTAAYSIQRRILAAAGLVGPIRLWKLNDHGPAVSFGPPIGRPFGSNVTALGLSPSGDIVAAGEPDGSVQLWDVSNPARPRQFSRLPAESSDAAAVAFSPDGGMLASGGADGPVRLWDVSRPRRPPHLAGTLREPAGVWFTGIFSLAFSSRGPLLATGADDGTIQLWNVANPARAKPLGRPLDDVAGAYASVIFGTDSTSLAVAGSKNTMQLWAAANPARPRPASGPLAISTRHGTASPQVLALAGTTALTSAYGVIQSWNADVNEAIKRICAIPGAGLTPAQWQRYIPKIPYTATCPR
jgi:WD40 repeat protein